MYDWTSEPARRAVAAWQRGMAERYYYEEAARRGHREPVSRAGRDDLNSVMKISTDVVMRNDLSTIPPSQVDLIYRIAARWNGRDARIADALATFDETVARTDRIATLPTTSELRARCEPDLESTATERATAAQRESSTRATGAARDAAGTHPQREQARWWGVDQGSARAPGQVSARTARDTEATRIARDVASGRSRSLGYER